MSPRRLATLIFEILLLLFIVSLLAGQFLGQPVLLGYVETGSMSPTLEAGDGFVSIPSAISGEVEQGDVVVFEAENLQGGGLTTHRIVGESDRGYITRGDANPFTDQDGEEPPVKDAQIVAKALQIGNTVVAIPNLGVAVTAVQDTFSGIQRWLAATLGTRALLGPQGIAYVLLGLSVIAYVADFLFADDPRLQRQRSRDRDTGYSTQLILLALALVLVISATAAMAVPAGTQQYGIVSAEFESERPTTIPTGESNDLEYTIPNAGVVPVHTYLEPASEGVAIDPGYVYVESRGSSTATLTLSAPPETGYYRRFLTEHRYLALLPKSAIDVLYSVHPWLPIIAIDLLLGGGLYVVGWLVIGRGRVRIRQRQRKRKLSLVHRVKRLLFGIG